MTARLHALIVADGEVAARAALDEAWPGWDDDVSLVVAADGGALRAAAIGLTPAVVVGDFDSLDRAELARLEAAGIPIERTSTDKDESDAELAVLAAIARGAGRITVLGAFGGPRLDHALANVWLLSHPALRAVDACLLDARVRIRLLDATAGPARATLAGRMGDVVTLAAVRRRRRGHHHRGTALPPGRMRRSNRALPAACPTCASPRRRAWICDAAVCSSWKCRTGKAGR